MTYSISKEQLTKFESLFKTSNKKDLYQSIVDAPFTDKLLTTYIDLGIIVLLLVNDKLGTIDRIAISDTDLAKGALKASAKPFSDIRIPLKTKSNILSEAIEKGEYRSTEDWYYMFNPVLTAEQARRNQISASIESSFVWPFKNSKKGALIFSYYQPVENIGQEHLKFMKYFTSIVSKYLY